MNLLEVEFDHGATVMSGHSVLSTSGSATADQRSYISRTIGLFLVFRKLWASLRSDRANVAVEFALALPVLLLMLLASAELGRFVLLHQKVDRVAVTISDLVARAETIRESELDDIFNAAAQVAEPFDLAGNGRVVVSSVINADGEGATIAWQRVGAGSFSTSSNIGVEGMAATLPVDFDVREGETAIISEVFFNFEPFLSDLIVAPQILYRRAHHRPRLGTLDTIEAG